MGTLCASWFTGLLCVCFIISNKLWVITSYFRHISFACSSVEPFLSLFFLTHESFFSTVAQCQDLVCDLDTWRLENQTCKLEYKSLESATVVSQLWATDMKCASPVATGCHFVWKDSVTGSTLSSRSIHPQWSVGFWNDPPSIYIIDHKVWLWTHTHIYSCHYQDECHFVICLLSLKTDLCSFLWKDNHKDM